MTTATDAFQLVLELLTWVGLVPGLTLLIIGYARRALSIRFKETWGVIIASPAGTTHLWFRWIDLDRQLRAAPVPLDGDESLEIGDEVKVYFDPRRPEEGRLDHPSTDGRILRVCGWALIGVGIASGIVQIITLFAE